MRAGEGTFSNQIARRLVAVAAIMGADPAALMDATGLSPALLVDPEGRLTLGVLHALFDECVRWTTASFGLRAAELTARHAETPLGLAVFSSPSLGEAYRRAARYSALCNDTLDIRLEVAGELAHVVHHQRHPLGAHRQGVEHSLAFLCLIGRAARGDAFRLHHVRFGHPAPRDVTEHGRLFGVAPAFSAPRNEIVFDRAHLDAPMPGASQRQLAHLDRLLDDELRARPRGEGFLERMRAILREHLHGGTPTIENVAAHLGTTPRSLQRRLRSVAGVSFQEVREELRRELAEDYLKRRELPLAEVSFLLGFSEPSTFHRAFRRWTGTTPDAWRRLAYASGS